MTGVLGSLWFHPAVIGPLLVARHWRKHGRLPKLWPPQDLSEKLLHRMLFDRRPLLTRLTGKLESRDYVLEKTGDPSLLIDMAGWASTAADLRALVLPERFIMKASHASGHTHIHRGPAPPDMDLLAAKLADWMGKRSLWQWGYRDLRRAVVVEHLLEQDGRVPPDYKFFCYDGRVHFINVHSDRFDGHYKDLFLPDWTWIDGRYGHPNATPRPPRPALLAEMIRVAEQISAGLDFVRVDLYAFGQQVKFGEITTYPAGGILPFDPVSLDTAFGAPWVLPGR